jgi:integrase
MSRRSGQTGCEERSGNWYVVRFWKDVEGQEERKLVREKICPISGPAKLSASERLRKRKEIIAASGADTVKHFDRVVRSIHGVTFREQAAMWLEQIRTRKRKPVAPSTISNWESALDNWVNPNIGGMPLDAVNNLAMKELVAKMVASGQLSPKSIGNYTQIVKMVVASAINEQGEELHPRKWNHAFIDMPVIVKKKQKTPTFTSEAVTGIVRLASGLHRMLFIVCAAAGLRIGEALGIDIKDVSPDGSMIAIKRKAWRGQIHERLKTPAGDRVIDLHPNVAAMLREYIGTRESGLLFCSKSGKQLWQSNILRRHLHPILKKLEWKDAELGINKAGSHAFRRFRNTYLRNYTSTPPGIYKFWMGHAEDGMSDLYDKIRSDVRFRKEVAERIGLGFDLPVKNAPVVPNVPKIESEPVLEMAASI